MSNDTHQETVLVRKTSFDDVYVPVVLDVYAPDITTPTRAPRISARNWLTTAVVLVMVASSTGLTYGHVTGTGAFFTDAESSTLNAFAANLLDFVVGSAPTGLRVTPAGPSVDVPLSVTPEPGSVPTNYRVTVIQTGGNAGLCNALVATVVSPPFNYTGPLLALSGVATLNPSLTLSVSLPAPVPDLPVDAPCTFDVVFKGWDARVAENSGYTDEERISVTIVDPPAADAPGALSATIETPPEEPAPQDPPAEVPPPAPDPTPAVVPAPDPVPEPEVAPTPPTTEEAPPVVVPPPEPPAPDPAPVAE